MSKAFPVVILCHVHKPLHGDNYKAIRLLEAMWEVGGVGDKLQERWEEWEDTQTWTIMQIAKQPRHMASPSNGRLIRSLKVIEDKFNFDNKR